MKKMKWLLSIVSIILMIFVTIVPNTFAVEDLNVKFTTLDRNIKAGDAIDVNIEITNQKVNSVVGAIKYNMDEFKEITSQSIKVSPGFRLEYIESNLEEEYTSILIFAESGDYEQPENGVIATITLKALENVELINNEDIYFKADIDAENDFYETEEIYVTLSENERESDDDLYLTTEKYKIGTSNIKRYQRGDKFLSRVSPTTSVSDFISNLDTNGAIDIYDNSDNKITDMTTLVATGMKIKVTKENCNDIDLDISVVADIDCNSKVTATDLAGMNQQILKEINLEGVQFISADISEDDKVTATDLAAIIQVILKDLVV